MIRVPTTIFIALGLVICIAESSVAASFRIASYNIKYLTACLNGTRERSLSSVIDNLNADIIGVQEVKDRKALEYFFDPEDWLILIDDESNDDQNLAFVIRNSVNYRLASGQRLNVGDSDFIFPNSSNFPDKRDVLKVYISLPQIEGEIEILNHHAKSRYDGRVTSESVRIGAALEIVDYIKASEPSRIILLGDFNDTPDDASLNTIENGQLSQLEMENDLGSLMVNLAEPVLQLDYVTYGLNTRSIVDESINATIRGSRINNYRGYDDDYEVRKALYDQILISTHFYETLNYPQIAIYTEADAIQGNDNTRASDHVPIMVTLFNVEDEVGHINITSILPNPVGPDNDHEKVTLRSTLPYIFSGTVSLLDAAGNQYETYIEIPPYQTTTITLQNTALSLNNSGDSVSLVYEGFHVQTISYSNSKEGTQINF